MIKVLGKPENQMDSDMIKILVIDDEKDIRIALKENPGEGRIRG